MLNKKIKLKESNRYYSGYNVTYTLGDIEVDSLNKILNMLLNKKFDWFIEVKIIFLETKKTNIKVPKLNGIIKVDEDWFAKQWREYHYSAPIPEPNIEDISIGDIVGGSLAAEISEEITKGLQLTISSSVEGFQWMNLYIRTEQEENNEIVTEETKQMDNKILNFLRRRANTEIFDIAGKQIKQVTFSDSDYLINSLQNKRKMEQEILYLLDKNGIINVDNYFNYFNRERNPEIERVIKTIRFFLKEVMP
jgi:hypothetical protein